MLTFVAAVLVASAQAQPVPSIEPTVASVQEAEPVPFRPAAGTELSSVRGVGVVAAPALSVAWFDVRNDVIWVAFRLATDHPVAFERLHLSMSDGSLHDVAVGSVAVRPAGDPRAPLVAIAELVEGSPPPSARTAGWLFQNRSDETVRVETVTYAPAGAARNVVLARTFGGAEPRAAFDAWLVTVEKVVTRTTTATGDVSPSALEAALRRSFPADLRQGDGSGLLAGIELAPGETLGLALTPAAFAERFRDATLFIDPAITTLAVDGVRRLSFSAGPTVRPHVP